MNPFKIIFSVNHHSFQLKHQPLDQDRLPHVEQLPDTTRDIHLEQQKEQHDQRLPQLPAPQQVPPRLVQVNQLLLTAA